MNTAIENELFLSTEYIRKNSLHSANSVRTEGDSLICEYLKRTLELLGCGEALDTYSELWYVLSSASYDEKALVTVLDNSVKENKQLLLIILSENIPAHPAIQIYAEMEWIAADEKLRRIRELIRSRHAENSTKVLLCDRLFGAGFDALSLKEILQEAQTDHKITLFETDMRRRFSAL